MKAIQMFHTFQVNFMVIGCAGKNVKAFHLKRQGILIKTPRRFLKRP
jgi:hypothetical protein